ncbi:hypothetical protein SSBR45G_67770 [Bradyrhizobium sp. SSBR45G]|uniref:hypothetical protein n=1 Tax=unclassified Bradyrhizobium TaxID=2631580 RepID=UPI002342B5DF|nr:MULTISPECIES: hypothetical protein [unclassified Bradyrhizobium]GLH81868.1 hypothetical protein SSBR45G_67770 [Bradyrhizobium sp. SSBR45G]GLH89347.1 hypothetical protein SSBR45R_68080 [Bradyrhizobium sp. SSBR45R]
MSEHDRTNSGRKPEEQHETQGAAPPEVKQHEAEKMPSAGPHARPELTDNDKTPGTGMLPEPGDANPSPTG